MTLQETPTPGFPTLSFLERDRRWAALRELMNRLDLDALVVSGMGRDQLDRYITNEGTRGLAVMPRAGEPISLVGTGNITLGRYDEPGREYPRWVSDQRLLSPTLRLPDVLADLGVSTSRIGVVGLSSRAPASMAGTIAYNTWARTVAALPAATFIDVAAEYEILMVVHSAEELTMIRKSAEIGENACRAMIETAVVGRRECEVVAAGMHSVASQGGMWLQGPQRTGQERLGWAGPDWLWMGGGSHALEHGDTFGAELFTFYGGFESQQQIEISLGEPTKEARLLEEVAIASRQAGLDILRPGVTFAQLCDAMEAPLRKAACWNMGPLVQTVSPVIFNSATHVGLEQDPAFAGIAIPHLTPRDGDFVIESGVAFAFEPNACHGKQRVCIGGTVIVTDTGYEELNSICNTVNVVRG